MPLVVVAAEVDRGCHKTTVGFNGLGLGKRHFQFCLAQTRTEAHCHFLSSSRMNLDMLHYAPHFHLCLAQTQTWTYSSLPLLSSSDLGASAC